MWPSCNPDGSPWKLITKKSAPVGLCAKHRRSPSSVTSAGPNSSEDGTVSDRWISQVASGPSAGIAWLPTGRPHSPSVSSSSAAEVVLAEASDDAVCAGPPRRSRLRRSLIVAASAEEPSQAAGEHQHDDRRCTDHGHPPGRAALGRASTPCCRCRIAERTVTRWSAPPTGWALLDPMNRSPSTVEPHPTPRHASAPRLERSCPNPETTPPAQPTTRAPARQEHRRR